MNEEDTRANYIDPMLQRCDWKPEHIIRGYYFTDGRRLLGGKRGERKYADYLLKHRNVNLAIIEAKKLTLEPTEGLQQAVDYAQILQIRFVYSTNGLRHYEFDMELGRGTFVDGIPTPDVLYERVMSESHGLKEQLLNQPFDLNGTNKPHYYQVNAVNKVMEAIANKQQRILITLATGTGKTFIAYQIVHKLFQTRWNLDRTDRRPKILFLADRNILANQAINTFNPYEKDLVKIDGSEVRRRNGIVPTNANLFFAIYQAIAEKEDIGGYYKQYPKDFFDLVIIDECHRGSANEQGTWRAILDHFSTAIHLGMTATPKNDANVDTYAYFGKAVYEYSLINGINDGFLTPYKVKRITTNIDEYIVSDRDEVVRGEHEQSYYALSDFERKLVLPQRTDLIAYTIIEQINTMDKTIVFCVNQRHALQMRDNINLHKKANDPHYCVRVTSDENELGRQFLERFQDNDKDIPVILTSSQMLTTGVDARNVRNIVLVREIKNMVEFKQIIGRGTRLFEGKDYFTIIDFTGATNLFHDPAWDGELIDSDEDGPRRVTGRPRPIPPDPIYPPLPPKEHVEVVIKNGKRFRVTDIETRFIDASGKPLTAKEFLEKLLDSTPELYLTAEELREQWSNPDKRDILLKKLEDQGFDRQHLTLMREVISAKDCDIFDVLSYLSFSSEMLTRSQRVHLAQADHSFDVITNVRARDFMRFVLQRYEKDDIDELKRDKLGELIKLNNLGTPREAAQLFGGSDKLVEAFYKLQETLYKAI
jgi:type I restriction enzyme R subunit